MSPIVAPPTGVILIELAGIILAARVVGLVFKRIGQPIVVGEIVAGVLLGKTVLNHIGSGYTNDVFPPASVPYLQVLAAVGLVLYMFVVGVEIDIDIIRGKEKVAASISVGSIIVPFAGGILLSWWLYSDHANGHRFLPFGLFVGAAMSITAFPVLARILTERGMHRTELGGIALASAAVDDILAWTLLAVVIIIADSGGADSWEILLGLPYLVFMFWVVRPLLRRLVAAYERAGRLEPNVLAIVLIGLFASAWATNWIGVHYIFGAFLFGAIMPRAAATAMLQEIVSRLEQVSMLLLLPVFFIVTGLNVDIGALSGRQLLELLAILGVAIGGKFIGAYLGASLQQIRPRRAGAVAVLMNTRGLTELVILSVGRQKGILDQNLYTLLVIMAIATTVMTGPLLKRIYPDRWVQRDVADAERQALGVPQAYRVVVVVDEPAEAEALVDLAVDLIGAERPAEIVLTNVRPYSGVRMEVGSGLRSQLLEVTAASAALYALSARVSEIPCTVLTRLGDDVVSELAAQLIAVDANVVIVRGAGPVADGLLERAVAQVVVAGDLAGTGVAAMCGHGSDGDAAVETALRVALSRHQPLVLMEGSGRDRRRAGAVAEELRQVGVAVTVEAPAEDTTSPAAPRLVVSPAGSQVSPAGLLVRAEHDRRPTDWDRVVRRVEPVAAST